MITLLEQFDTIFDTPESVQKLQRLILDMAVQGKLVQQNPNDEPASVLLESAKAERKQLVKEKKIKKESVLPLITEGEEPYRLPKGWEWGRLGELGNIFNGNSINAKIKEERYSKVTQGYDYIATKDIDSQTREIKYENGIKIPFHENKFKVAHEGSVLICAEGGSAGKKIGILSKDVCFGNKLFVTETYGEINNKYIFYIYQSSFFYKSFSSRMTGIIGGISIGKFKEILVPIPPVPEQKRIVEKIEKLMSFCRKLKEQLENKHTKEDRLNIAAFVSLGQSETEEELKENLQFVLSHLHSLCTDTKHIQQLRNAVLSLAMKGKLVSQYKNDEPASVLLERIKQEKEQLIKEKKIKKEKTLPNILEEENPFEIPNGWEWTFIDNIGFTVTGKTPPTNNPTYYEGKIPFLNPANITNGIVSYGGKKISEEGAKYSQIIPNNSILIVCINGSLEKGIGRAGKITKSVAFNQQINAIVPNESLNSDYLLLAIRSPFFQKQIKEKATGTVNYIINKNAVRSLSLPLPPLNEQNRIVEKVSRLMSFCDELEKNIEHSKQESEKLMKAVLQEAFMIKEEVLN
ncbi:restriction endonuclease subunit S [Bacillus wiedmannii]|uniref:restriction endonuclease subunit S n=1 Tax=Bacillus wiedmannii TaxID=1890302 RepID=UPI003F9101B1